MNTDVLLVVINMVVAVTIVTVMLYNRHKLVEQNIIERMGHNFMVIACTCIAVKMLHDLTIGTFKFDVYGMLFRCGYLVYLIGSLYSTHRDGVSLLWKSDQAKCFVTQAPKQAAAVPSERVHA